LKLDDYEVKIHAMKRIELHLNAYCNSFWKNEERAFSYKTSKTQKENFAKTQGVIN